MKNVERSFKEIREERNPGMKRYLTRCLSGYLFNAYLAEAWSAGNGVCGEDWNWNHKLVRIQKLQDRLIKLV